MHSWFMEGTTGRGLAALTVALVTTLAGCGGGEIDSEDGAATSQGAPELDGRAQSLSAGTSMLDSALSQRAVAFGPAAGITEAQKFGAPNEMAGDLFGLSVAAVGSRVVVGSPQESVLFRITNTRGSAYMFDEAGSFVRELLPTSTTELRRDDAYGRAVAGSGNLIAVGSPGADDVGQFAGEVFVFDAQTGAQVAKLVPTGTRRNPADGAGFGSAVDVSTDRIVVGAPGTFIAGAGNIGGHGAIYLFDANTRRLITRVTPPGTRAKDNVGHSVTSSMAYAVNVSVLTTDPHDSVVSRLAPRLLTLRDDIGIALQRA